MKVLITRLDESEFEPDVDMSSWSPEFLRIDSLSWGQLSRWRVARRSATDPWKASWILIQQFDRPWDRICVWSSKTSVNVKELQDIVDKSSRVFLDSTSFNEKEHESIRKCFENFETLEAIGEF